jgi:hypothetical protein
MNEHALAREALEVAAVEPRGLDRLEAGDTPEAAAVVGHLAGCPSCLDELGRLRRTELLLRPIVAELPDPALRERTLAFVREVGVRREAPSPSTLGAVPAAGPTSVPARAPAASGRRRAAVPAWLASLAAALVVGLVGGSLLAGQGGPEGNTDPAVALAAASREAAAMSAAGDVVEVPLADASGATLGTALLAPAADRVLVLATGLDPAPAGYEYRCWVEVGGSRTAIGTMWPAGDVSWWAGAVDLPAELPPGAVYGVSLVEAGADGPGSVVLSGTP